MHSPKSSRASMPSLANKPNRSCTFPHNSSLASPDLLMNLRPFRALCALDLVRSSFALIFRAFRAVVTGSSAAATLSTDADDSERSHGNFLRILDVIERLRATPPTPPSSTPPLLDDGEALGAEYAAAGVTLQRRTASFSSSSVISTSSLWWLLRRSLRNTGIIAP